MLDKNKTYLITGGTGYLGDALITRLEQNGMVKLKSLSRSEAQIAKAKERHPNVEYIVGDIINRCVVEEACNGVSGIFHLAASKHIGMAEEYPYNCIKTNIEGTLNLLDQTYWKDIDFIIGISTDKAAQVNGVYGATKMLMERLFQEAQKTNKECEYRIVRYGNVLYSTGSVLCKWKEKIKNNEEIIVTNPNATRFYWTVEQAIDLIFECLDKAIDATPYCPEMKSIVLGDLLEAMKEKYGSTSPIKTIGLQAGENMHETIDGKIFSNEVEQYSEEEIMKMI